MSTEKEYKSVVLRLVPTPREEKILERNLMKVSKFLEISKREFQKLIRHKAREHPEIGEAHSRLVDLLAQRFANTVMGNLLYPLDNRNYRFVKQNGWYKIAVKFKPRSEMLIPVARSDCRYYGELLENTAYPAFIFKDGGNYFLSVSIPFKRRWEKGQRPTVYIGIDLNQRKHAASLYNPQTDKYERNLFFDLKPVDRKVKELQRKITAIQKGKRFNQLTEEEREKIDKLNETIKKVIQKGHGDFIVKLIEVADGYWERGYNIVFVLEELKGITKRAGKSYAPFNQWLHSQWCYRKFGVMLEAKPYRVVYVKPKDTSKLCHKCGSEVKIYGKHNRLIKCEVCGYRDFSRDLNAARNIAKKGGDTF